MAVILSAAKDLFVQRARPFAALRVTGILSKCLTLRGTCGAQAEAIVSRALILTTSSGEDVLITKNGLTKKRFAIEAIYRSAGHPWPLPSKRGG